MPSPQKTLSLSFLQAASDPQLFSAANLDLVTEVPAADRKACYTSFDEVQLQADQSDEQKKIAHTQNQLLEAEAEGQEIYPSLEK